MPYKINKSIFFNYLFVLFLVSCNNETPKLYFDANWKETTKENASYYREIPKNEKDLWLIKDFYITGEKQFIGQANDSLATNLEGNVTWYFKTGKVQNKVRYHKGKIVGYYSPKSGVEGSEKEGWNDTDLYFIDYTDAMPAEDAKSSNSSVNEYYYTNSSQIASQHTSHIGANKNVTQTIYFDKKGEVIAHLEYNQASEKWKGKEVVFYENELRGKNEMNSIKYISTYENGVITSIEYYNTQEELIAKGTLKKEKPFTGTFYQQICGLYKIQQYHNGSLLSEITYNTANEKIGAVTFKNAVPKTGVYFNCNSLQTYKNGQLHGKSIQYFDDNAEDVEFEFTFKNGLKHGEYVIYQDVQYILEKGTYKDGIQKGNVVYYHNGTYSENEDEQHNYYIKATIISAKNKHNITEFSQFNSDDNVLIKTFVLAPNDTDRFTYLNNGYHSIIQQDLNNDGFQDLQITYSHHQHDIQSNTYYLFNSKTNKYVHLPKLNDAINLEITPPEHALKAQFKSKYEGQKRYFTYHFLNNTLKTTSIIEEVYNYELDSIITTQIFPKDIAIYPLLDNTLPALNIVQHNNIQDITNLHQEITLTKHPFSIIFPGLVNTKPPFGFCAKVTASYQKAIFKKASINQREEETSIFNNGTTLAGGANNPYFIIDDSGHNIFYYDATKDDTLDLVENINNTVKLFQFHIDKIHDGEEEIPVSALHAPLYMVIYMDKNRNLKIDKNEIHYVTLNFQK